MIYSSYTFIFFVAGLLYIYYKLPKASSAVLLFGSILWYSSWGLIPTALLIGISVVNYLFLLLKERFFTDRSYMLFPFLIFLNLMFFVSCKFIPSFFPRLSSPLGLSFFMLSLMAFMIDRFRATDAETPSFIDFLLLPFFFPALVGGPIQKDNKFFPQLKNQAAFQWTNVIDGGLVFSYGYFKRFFFYDTLSRAILYFEHHAVSGSSYLHLGLACLLYAFRAYIEFSSYCDMGRGVSRCFGIKLNINFRPFYYSKNPIEFWQRWNISLGEWIRDYITMPLLLKFGKYTGYSLVMLFSFLLVGLWHGIASNWVLFGLANGLLVAVYFHLQTKFSKRAPRFVLFSGLFLVVLLQLANGLLQNPDFYRMMNFNIQLPPQKFAELSSFFNFASVASLIGLLLVEYWQERSGKIDFYLDFPFNAKLAGFVSLVTLFFVVLHTGFGVTFKELPPLYFRF